jgi:MtrB/PioB family decaheme-associated outer membrane protein
MDKTSGMIRLHAIRGCRRPSALLALTIAGILAAGTSAAQEADRPDMSNWKCSKCPFPSGHDASYALGGSYLSDDAAHFGDATGYDEKGGYVEANGEGGYADGAYRMRWTLEDLGLDSRYAELEGGRQGSFDYRLAYRELPHRVFDTTESVYTRAARDELALPPGWVRAPATSGFASLGSSLVPTNIDSDRQYLEAGGSFFFARNFEIFANYQRENRDGTDMLGGAFFTQGNLLARPFDYQTDTVDLGLRWGGPRGHVVVAYYGSFFQDHATALIWDNAFTGPDRGALAQPPDNSFQQVTVSGAWRMAFDTVIAISGAIGRMEQNDAFLPYTINPTLAPADLPRASLDGQVDTSNLALTVTSRPLDIVRIKAAWTYDERDNQTTVETWSRTLVDTFNANDPEQNVPYGYQRDRINLSADLDVIPTLRISGGYDRNHIDRDHQEVASQIEDSGWGRIRWRPASWLDLNARAGAAKREVNRYDEDVAASRDQNPLMRKYELADRSRDFAQLMVTTSLPSTPLSISVDYTYARDDYSKSVMGLTKSDDQRLGADFTYSPTEHLSFNLNGGYQDISSRQAGSESFADPDWSARYTDRFVTYGAGARIANIADRFDLNLDYVRAEGTSRVGLDTAASGAAQFPDLASTLDDVKLTLTWRISARFETELKAQYQKFRASDWALEGVGPATVPTVLTLGADPYDYDVTLVGLAFRYNFGSREIKLPSE